MHQISRPSRRDQASRSRRAAAPPPTWPHKCSVPPPCLLVRSDRNVRSPLRLPPNAKQHNEEGNQP